MANRILNWEARGKQNILVLNDEAHHAYRIRKEEADEAEEDLFEQVVGRGLRRRTYEVGADGLMTEEVAKVFGVPFQVIPFKANPAGRVAPPPARHHVHALPGRAQLEIRFPRVEGYRQAIRNRITADFTSMAPLWLDPAKIPPEVEVKASLPTNSGRPSLSGPRRLQRVDLSPFRQGRRGRSWSSRWRAISRGNTSAAHRARRPPTCCSRRSCGSFSGSSRTR